MPHLNRVCDFFQAMADETRLKILLLLEERERCVGELVSKFHLSQPTISNHLLVLKRAGLVRDRREGKRVCYSLNGNSLRECCAGYFGQFECCDSLFRAKVTEFIEAHAGNAGQKQAKDFVTGEEVTSNA